MQVTWLAARWAARFVRGVSSGLVIRRGAVSVEMTPVCVTRALQSIARRGQEAETQAVDSGLGTSKLQMCWPLRSEDVRMHRIYDWLCVLPWWHHSEDQCRQSY